MSGMLDDWDFGGPMTDEDFRQICKDSREKSEREKHNERARNNPNKGGQNWD